MALGVAILVYVALEFWLTRGTTLFIDEVSILQQNAGLHPSELFAPFNEHLELARRLVYAIGFKLFPGSGAFLLAKVVQTLSVVLLAVVFFAFIEKRIGAAAALPPTFLVLFFGSAWELDYAISGIGNVLALAAGIGALLMIERRGRSADLLVCILLTISVMSFTTGPAVAVGALVYLLINRDSRRRLWIALAPLAVFAAWLVWVRLGYVPAHGNVQPVTLSNILLAPNEIAQQGASTLAALAGVNYSFEPTDVFGGVFSTASVYGGALFLIGAAALVQRIRRRGATRMLWTLIAVLVAYWIELAVGSGPGRSPNTVRYVYFGGATTLLLIADAWGRPLITRRGLAVLYGLLAFSLLGNVARLRDGMHFYRSFGTAMRAQLAAIQVAQPAISPGFQTYIGVPPFVPLTAGPYLAAVARNGSPAFSDRELRRQPENVRQTADEMLVAALGVRLVPRVPSLPLRYCLRAAGRPRISTKYTFHPPGLALRSDVRTSVSVGQFSDSAAALGSLAAGQPTELRVPRDGSSLPWQVTLTPGPASLLICAP